MSLGTASFYPGGPDRPRNAAPLSQDRAEVEACRRALGETPAAMDSLTPAWQDMGWDAERMCWTDPEAQRQMEEAAAAAAREIEAYPAATGAELGALRDRELDVA